MKFGPMKTHRRNRLVAIGVLVLGVGCAVTLAMMALNENVNLFYAPDQIVQGEAPIDRVIRAGGMVKAGSIVRSETDLRVRFTVSDLKESEFDIEYVGVLPDLFREGQGVIAKGKLDNTGVFQAEEVLAKHDENYMPPEVQDVLAKAHDGVEGAP